MVVNVDTPGFSQLEPTGLSSDNLALYFPEFIAYRPHAALAAACMKKSRNSLREAAAAGRIAQSGTRIICFLTEIRQQERSY